MVHYHRTIKMSPNEAEKLCIPQLSLEKGDSVMDVLKEAASIKLNIQKIKKETEKAAHQANKTYLKGKIVVQYQVNRLMAVLAWSLMSTLSKIAGPGQSRRQ